MAGSSPVLYEPPAIAKAAFIGLPHLALGEEVRDQVRMAGRW